MEQRNKPVRVLYSFGLKIGADRICNIAWQHVNALAAAGAEVTCCPACICRSLPETVQVHPTLAWGKVRLPNRLLGRMAYLGLHDMIVARRLRKHAEQFDIVHTWPLGALRTLKTAQELNIPSALERPNAYTPWAYDVVDKECKRLGVELPRGHEHAIHPWYIRREEAEYKLADALLCPSDFVLGTFVDQGFPRSQLVRHQYGYDEKVFHPGQQQAKAGQGLTMLFAGGCAPRKALHYALEAWVKSEASKTGTFLVAGQFVPGYAEKLSSMLSHPSVKVLGHRKDVADLMRQSDIFILPSIEEGSALVTSEARACGCVLVVSEATGAYCRHMENALVHRVGDVVTLTQQLTLLHQDRALLARLRAESLKTVHEITWRAAGIRLREAYREIIESKQKGGGK